MSLITWRDVSGANQAAASALLNNSAKGFQTSADSLNKRGTDFLANLRADQGATQDLEWLNQANQYTNKDTLQSDLAGIAVGKQADKAKIAEYMLKRPGQLSDMAINRQNIAQNQFKLDTNQGNLDRDIESHNSGLAKDKASIFSSNSSARASNARAQEAQYDFQNKKDIAANYDAASVAAKAFYKPDDKGNMVFDDKAYNTFVNNSDNNIDRKAGDSVISEANLRSGKTGKLNHERELDLKRAAPTVRVNGLLALNAQDKKNKATSAGTKTNALGGKINTPATSPNIGDSDILGLGQSKASERSDAADVTSYWGGQGQIPANTSKNMQEYFTNGSDFDAAGYSSIAKTLTEFGAAGGNVDAMWAQYLRSSGPK